MQEIIGYAAALLIGLSLGVIGGGGSILTLPVLTYLMGVEPTLATAYSLFIVGSTALVGGIKALWQKQADIKTALWFGAPSIVAVYATRKFILPAIPDSLIGMEKSVWIMLLFALIMIPAAYSMIKKPGNKETKAPRKIEGAKALAYVMAEGTIVGILTGLVGAGGGFLIIPVLVVVSGLPMKTAVGTSLLIVAAKSLIGFTGDLGNPMDWNLLFTVTGISIAGILLGMWVAKWISGEKLKPAFGYFVLVMAGYILFKEFWPM